MLKFVILFLGAFTLMLWTALVSSPVQAQPPSEHTVVYSWGYDRLGSPQKVCKQLESFVTLDPRYPDKPSLHTHSRRVDERYCS
ncbi:hypothetical protein PMG71_14625 [Roseofilum sp. BLCC_M154]|uniref:Secreted protein n=1 Tax=Roseofilum acuticapitatum BLCC-M154 TaxID=3022444 RepID=A0ABT7AUT4_9CYAN|nr:hypothetical protein [Roseofilum acuticapitatum]MDJ1170664.1 hypothetical protein [Roseofilum acuticapitatum BLCC-M154]